MMRAWRIGSALALALGGPLAGPLCARQPLTLEDYALSLEEVQRLVEQGRLVEAQTAARGLRDRAVAWHDETLAADASALDAVVEARSAAEAARAARRLGRLAGALRQPPQAAAPAEAEPDVLERITPVDPLKRGGAVASLRVKPLTLPERVEAALFAVSDAISSLMRTLREWLDRLRPARAPRPSAPGSTAVAALVFALVVVVVLSVLVIRRRRLAAALPAGEPLRPHPSRRDEDPLSRGASEWERHASELAAARRWREAIRAWYHAVLVSLFRHGLLHHQKGRTNWEYVARLEPSLAWRPEFMELTSLFDREWYGRRTSDADAHAECARAARSLLATLRGAGALE